jgi:hypothetical protein
MGDVWADARDYLERTWPLVLMFGVDSAGRCACGRASCRTPGKHPVARAWQERPIRGADELEAARKAAAGRPRNVGLLLGEASGLADIEGDSPEGDREAEELLANSPSLAYRSSRGTHRIYKLPADLAGLPRTAVTHVGLVEVRLGLGAAAASCLPPSRHASGFAYAWLPGRSPAELELAELPEGLISRLRGPQTQPGFRVEADLASDQGAAEGSRRETLCRLVGRHLREHGADAELPTLVAAWCRRCKPPFDELEAAGLVESLGAKERARAASIASPATMQTPAVARKEKLRLRTLAEVEHKPATYILGTHWPVGKLALLAADGGLGKTALTCEVAARLSRAEATPLAGDIIDASSLIVSAEDDESTIRARCELLGGDLKRIYTLAEEEAFENFANDTGRLEEALADLPDVRLLVFDSLPDFMGAADDHKNKEVRRAVSAIRDLAKRRDLAVVGIAHFSKGGNSSGARLLGSVAYRNLPRSIGYLLRDPSDEECRLLFHEKTNGPASPTWRYRMRSTPAGIKIEWEAEPTKLERHEVERMLTSPSPTQARTYKPTQLDAAAKLLAEGMAGATWTSAADLLALAEAAGVSKSSLYEAATRLRIEKASGWWRMPEPEASS